MAAAETVFRIVLLAINKSFFQLNFPEELIVTNYKVYWGFHIASWVACSFACYSLISQFLKCIFFLAPKWLLYFCALPS